jgi:hypothetical protein
MLAKKNHAGNAHREVVAALLRGLLERWLVECINQWRLASFEAWRKVLPDPSS